MEVQQVRQAPGNRRVPRDRGECIPGPDRDSLRLPVLIDEMVTAFHTADRAIYRVVDGSLGRMSLVSSIWSRYG